MNLISWKTTLAGIILLLAGAVAIADHDSLKWLGSYEGSVQSGAKFLMLLATSAGLLAAKDSNVTGGDTPANAESAKRIAPPGATCPPPNPPYTGPLLVVLLALPLLLAGCATPGTTTTTGTTTTATTGDANLDMELGLVESLTSFAVGEVLDLAVSPADLADKEALIHASADAAAKLANGQVPTPAQFLAAFDLPDKPHWTKLTQALQGSYAKLYAHLQGSTKLYAAYISAVLAGIADATATADARDTHRAPWPGQENDGQWCQALPPSPGARLVKRLATTHSRARRIALATARRVPIPEVRPLFPARLA